MLVLLMEDTTNHLIFLCDMIQSLPKIAEIKWLKNEQEFVPDGTRVKAFLNEDGTFGLIFEATEADDKVCN